jgi:hypothetical protein
MERNLNDITWRKARRSGSNGGDCVEIAATWRKSRRSADNGGSCVEVAVMEIRTA